jgi:GGDEF domain-containing protein
LELALSDPAESRQWQTDAVAATHRWAGCGRAGNNEGVTEASHDGSRLGIVQLLRDESDAIVSEWREMCRWDPMLPPESTPPIAPALISAVADALDHPQPLGWGPDPEMEKVVGAFTLSAGSLEVAIGELVCLGEALRRRLFDQLPESETGETHLRLEMLIDRAIGAAAQQAAVRTQVQTLIDAGTGLLNTHALDRDLRREIARAVRYKRALCLVVLLTKDVETLASPLRELVRAGDLAYRIDENELAAVLAEAGPDEGRAVVTRLEGSGGPAFRAGVAAYPDDGTDPEALIEAARARAESLS